VSGVTARLVAAEHRVVHHRGRLAGRYPAVAAMVVCALVPYLALSAALEPLTPIVARQLHSSLQTLSLGSGMANAAYAVGTVLAVLFAQHLPQRRVMVFYALLLVIGSVLTAAAGSAPVFIAGHILQGLCTSLLLIAAVPPLALGFGRERLRETGVIMNVCIFGAVALGPTIGGIQAESHAWRPLFWIVAGVSLTALVLSLLTYEDQAPADPTAPKDFLAVALAGAGPICAFWGAAELLTHPFLRFETVGLLAIGFVLIIGLITYQALTPRPLLTIGRMLRNTISVSGIVVALFAAAASVSATALTASLLMGRYSALHVGLLYLPELGGAIITAFALGALLTRKGLHYLPLAGMAFLAAGIVVFAVQLPPTPASTLIGSGLTGIGLGATVAPALFVAGFSLPSANLQRVFAIVELLRAVAAFMIAPVFAHFAATVGGSPTKGTGLALWIGLGLAVGGASIAVSLYLLGGARPQAPDFDEFLEGTEAAWDSPPLLAAVRRHPRVVA
jgi:MFS family permease